MGVPECINLVSCKNLNEVRLAVLASCPSYDHDYDQAMKTS